MPGRCYDCTPAADVLNKPCADFLQEQTCLCEEHSDEAISLMQQFLDDPVDVLAAFSRHRIKPLRVRWNDRNYDIKHVNLVHTAREGVKRVFYFSVSDTVNAFKLRLDPDLLEWRLVELYTDG